MNISKILSSFLASEPDSDGENESKEKAANVIDRVIKENKETFDELAKY